MSWPRAYGTSPLIFVSLTSFDFRLPPPFTVSRSAASGSRLHGQAAPPLGRMLRFEQRPHIVDGVGLAGRFVGPVRLDRQICQFRPADLCSDQPEVQ